MFQIEYINNSKLFDSCIKYLSSVNSFAFDLEFDHYRFSYGFNLCLIQIATDKRCFVIDPISKINLNPLFDLFENEKILKIVHSSGEDLRLLNQMNCYPKNLFDTDIVTKFLNYDLTSLSAMLKLKLNVDIDKRFQKSNWNIRPLLKEQINYAANDVIYLFRLKEILEKEAKEKQVFDFIQEEFEMLNHTTYKEVLKENFLKGDDIEYLSEYNSFLLNELLRFQDSIAKKLNKPPHQLIEYNVMKDLVLDKIKLENWLSLKGIIWRLKTEEFKIELENKIKELKIIAKEKNLSKKKPKKLFPTKEKKIEGKKLREEFDIIKENKFIPIKNEIANLYGVNCSKYILSDKNIDRIIKRSLKIHEIKPHYKEKLLKEISKKLKIDLSSYL